MRPDDLAAATLTALVARVPGWSSSWKTSTRHDIRAAGLCGGGGQGDALIIKVPA